VGKGRAALMLGLSFGYHHISIGGGEEGGEGIVCVVMWGVRSFALRSEIYL
jgi:hypothetical protein